MAEQNERSYWLRRRLSRRAGLRAGSAVAAGSAAFLVACGGGDKQDEGGARQDGQATAANVRNQVAAPTGQPKRGGTMTFRVAATPPLDPHTNTTFRAQVQAGFVYSGMLKFKTGYDPAAAYNY